MFVKIAVTYCTIYIFTAFKAIIRSGWFEKIIKTTMDNVRAVIQLK